MPNMQEEKRHGYLDLAKEVYDINGSIGGIQANILGIGIALNRIQSDLRTLSEEKNTRYKEVERRLAALEADVSRVKGGWFVLTVLCIIFAFLLANGAKLLGVLR